MFKFIYLNTDIINILKGIYTISVELVVIIL